MSRFNLSPDETSLCPFCKSSMYRVYVKTGGGVWFHEKSDFMTEGVVLIDTEFPLHCLIGKSGARSDVGKWPKEGFFCKNCNAIAFRK